MQEHSQQVALSMHTPKNNERGVRQGSERRRRRRRVALRGVKQRQGKNLYRFNVWRNCYNGTRAPSGSQLLHSTPPVRTVGGSLARSLSFPVIHSCAAG